MQSIVEFKKHHSNSIIPSLAGPNEIGFDLTIIEKIKDINSNTAMYDTYISVKPSDGFYFEIVPRSSLSKTGYILTNSIGIIDPTYRGTLKIVLTKINEQAPDIILPNKKFQLIPRFHISKEMIVKEVDELDMTERGEGGFGSTDTNN